MACRIAAHCGRVPAVAAPTAAAASSSGRGGGAGRRPTVLARSLEERYKEAFTMSARSARSPTLSRWRQDEWNGAAHSPPFL
jgi:hypothetical protein